MQPTPDGNVVPLTMVNNALTRDSLSALKSDDEAACSVALCAIRSRLSDPHMCASLLQILDVETCNKAAIAQLLLLLAEKQVPGVLNLAVKALSSDNDAVQSAAIKSLVVLNDENAFSHLKTYYESIEHHQKSRLVRFITALGEAEAGDIDIEYWIGLYWSMNVLMPGMKSPWLLKAPLNAGNG